MCIIWGLWLKKLNWEKVFSAKQIFYAQKFGCARIIPSTFDQSGLINVKWKQHHVWLVKTFSFLLVFFFVRFFCVTFWACAYYQWQASPEWVTQVWIVISNEAAKNVNKADALTPQEHFQFFKISFVISLLQAAIRRTGGILRLCLSVCCVEAGRDTTALLSPALSSSARWEWV